MSAFDPFPLVRVHRAGRLRTAPLRSKPGQDLRQCRIGAIVALPRLAEASICGRQFVQPVYPIIPPSLCKPARLPRTQCQTTSLVVTERVGFDPTHREPVTKPDHVARPDCSADDSNWRRHMRPHRGFLRHRARRLAGPLFVAFRTEGVRWRCEPIALKIASRPFWTPCIVMPDRLADRTSIFGGLHARLIGNDHDSEGLFASVPSPTCGRSGRI